ncbi:MAG: hypothetical protein HC875_32265 [Anaerolineales bacterium]|nr:hypothetical protein [Anaerolineales bacterium]
MSILTSKSEQPYQRRTLTWLDRLQLLPWWGQCAALWLATLLVLTAVGLIAVQILDLREGYDPIIGVPPNSVPGIWARWDSPYYIHLARDGYAAVPYAMGYFPLYPLLMRGLSNLTGLSLAFSGMLISQLSYLAAILFFYKLARLIRDDHAYAMRCVLYLVLFPSSFFFFAVYAEPLSLAFSILAVWLTLGTPPRYHWSGLALGIASAARPVGWLLNLILLAEFGLRRKFKWAPLFSLAVGLMLSVLGVVAFVFYLYSITGTFMAIPKAQSQWLRHWELPWVTLEKSIFIALTGNGVENDWFLYVINWSDLLCTLLVLALTVVAFVWSLKQRFKWSLTIYLIITLIFLLAQQGLEEVPLWGMTRWVAAIFPLYLILGDISRRKIVQGAIALVSGCFLILFMAWWTSGRWIG